MSECCSENAVRKKVLFYACSGGANVAEASDKACRQMMSDGLGSMFCLAGLGAGIENMIQQARDADLNVVIDGCETDCAQGIFNKLGLTNLCHVRVTDLGLEKTKGVRASDEQVNIVVDRVKQVLSEARPPAV